MGGELGGILQWDTNRREGKRMQVASKDANAMQAWMYEQQKKDNEPWRQAGTQALGQLSNQNNFKDFSMAEFQKDPSYQFGLEEGQKALERSAAARGGLNSGATMKALEKYGQDYAGTKYNEAYNRFTADRDARFNRLASVAGIGQVANQQVGQAGSNYANQFGNNLMSGANARAAANISGMQSLNQGFENSRQMAAQVGGGAMAMFCDVNVKKNFSPITEADIKEFRENIQPLFFQYISSEFGEGDFIGPIAQDLEKSKLGRTLVKVNGQGIKYLDENRVLMLLLALQGKVA